MECADADKYDRIYCNALTVINKIVFTSPEAMVEFSGEKNITSALVKTFANIYRVCAGDVIKFSNPKLKSH